MQKHSTVWAPIKEINWTIYLSVYPIISYSLYFRNRNLESGTIKILKMLTWKTSKLKKLTVKS